MIITNFTRRLALFSALAAVSCLALSGCGSDESSQEPGAFAQVESAYGQVLVEDRPIRVVALSTQYADMLAAIGVEPVAYTTGSASPDDAPWLSDLELGEFDSNLLTLEGTASLEQIASYEPDLILGNVWSIDENQWAEATQFAATYVGSIEGNPDWTETLRAVGELVGKSDAAEAAITEVEQSYEQTQDELPGLQGKTYNYIGYFEGQQFAYGNGSWLDGFGLIAAEGQGNEQTGTMISMENLGQFNADVLAVFMQSGSRSDIEADPRFADLPAARNRSVLFLDYVQALAVTAPGPHSLVWAMEQVTPVLAESALSRG